MMVRSSPICGSICISLEANCNAADLNDFDDPLATQSQPLTGNIGSSSQPLDQGYLTSSIPGEDRRAPQNTIDETVWETVRRDLFAVWAKLKEVLYPRYLLGGSMFESEGGLRGAYSNIRGAGLQGTRDELTGLATRAVDAEALLQSSLSPGLRDWDLWGPLIFCLLLSLLLSFSPRAQAEQKDIIFSGVFATIWLGEALVTFQIRLLGGNMYVNPSLPPYCNVLTYAPRTVLLLRASVSSATRYSQW